MFKDFLKAIFGPVKAIRLEPDNEGKLHLVVELKDNTYNGKQETTQEDRPKVS